MSKLIKMIAASIGGGLVLGAGIRIGEAIASRSGSPPEPDTEDKLTARLSRIEEKLSRTATPPASPPSATTPADGGHEWQAVFAGIGARIDRQQSDVEAIRQQLKNTAQSLESVNSREDFHRQLREDLDRRVEALEEKLRLRMEASQEETAAAMLKVMEDRISPRIGRLERDVSGQSAAVSELRECSIKTEQSIQRLVAVLDRAVSARPEVKGREQSLSGEPAFRPAIF